MSWTMLCVDVVGVQAGLLLQDDGFSIYKSTRYHQQYIQINKISSTRYHQQDIDNKIFKI